MSALVQDVRFAARSLAKQPSLAVAAVVTLALGIGANTAIFSLVSSVLLTPPPFREPGRLVVIWASNPRLATAAGLPDLLPVSSGDFYDWQRQARSFFALATVGSGRMTLTGAGEATQVGAVRVTGDFSAVMGTPALLGRLLTPADEVPGRPQAALLSYAFWQRHFGGDPSVVGRKVGLDREPVTIAGVMPPRFEFPRGSEMPAGYGFTGSPDMWVPLALPLKMRQNRGDHNALAVARLRPGVGVAAAEAELRAICRRLAVQYADSDEGWSARLVPVGEQMVSNVRPALLVLWAAVAFVLLIACANVANLLLARAAARRKEIALRTAIGAGRGRLIRQLLTESGLLAAAGAVLGVALAWGGLRLFAALLPPGLGGAAVYVLDGRVLAFTAVLGLVASVLAGLVPALEMSRPDLTAALREGTRGGTATGAGRRTRGLLVVAEVALAVLLLIGAGLLMRSFVRVLEVDPGFRAAHLLTFDLDLPPDRVTAPERLHFFSRVLDRLRALPGADGAAAVSNLPLSGTENIGSVAPDGRVAVKPTDFLTTDRRLVLGDYLGTMGIRLRRGRLLDAADSAGRQRAAVIDGTLARAAWPGQDPLGRRLRGGRPEPSAAEDPANPWFTVVGEVASVHHSALSLAPRPQLYLPLLQVAADQVPRRMSFVVRAAGDPLALAAAVRAAVHEVDRDTPVSRLRTLDQVVADSVAGRRFNLLLLALFAGLALALSAVGIYGLTSYAVVQRTRELGLRMALGALPSGLLRLLLAEVGALAGAGLLLGLVAALALTRVMASLLFGVGSTDPLTFAGVGLGLAVIALVSAWVPGRRATFLDPMVALRAD